MRILPLLACASGPLALTAHAAQGATALPRNSLEDVPKGLGEGGHGTMAVGGLSRRRDKVPLRILSLGASIVFGMGSTDDNGFRLPLRQVLRYNGYQVDMVGTLQHGAFIDNEHDGHPGADIETTRDDFRNASPLKPNVVLVNSGTTDANRNINPLNATDRMRFLLQDIWAAEDMAPACVFLSTLVPTLDHNGLEFRPILNRGFRGLVDEFRGAHCIYLADMDPPTGHANGWMVPDLGPDGVHLNDEGNRKIASVFWKAIEKASDHGSISPAVEIQTDCADKDDGPACGLINRQGDDPGCCDVDPQLPLQPGAVSPKMAGIFTASVVVYIALLFLVLAVAARLCRPRWNLKILSRASSL